MMDTVYQYNPIYTDTDSVLLEKTDYLDFINDFPNAIGKDFG